MFGRKRVKEFRDKSLTRWTLDICWTAAILIHSFPPKKEEKNVSLGVDESLDIQFLCKQPLI